MLRKCQNRQRNNPGNHDTHGNCGKPVNLGNFANHGNL